MINKEGLMGKTVINGVVVKEDLIPVTNTTSRQGIKINPTYITIHNTANPSVGADAEANSKYVDNTEDDVSWHFTVDEDSILQELPVYEKALHTGTKTGNISSIGIEICENADGNYAKSEENAIALTAYLMKELNIPIRQVVPHQSWSGKHCPHIILDSERGWFGFMKDLENKALLSWEEILVKCLDQPSDWIRTIDALKKIASMEVSIGDFELLMYIDELIEKIYRSENVSLSLKWNQVLTTCLEQPDNWIEVINNLKTIANMDIAIGEFEILKYIDELIVKIYKSRKL